ncbi:MAG: GHKL domain-containing protein [Clostridia bacterium]|nr:GHKL domain-containing protein [Clostridia bacterium]
MIKQLRRRFVVAIMASALALIVVVLTAINIVVIFIMDNSTTYTLEKIVENDGVAIDVSSDYRANVLDYFNPLSGVSPLASEVSYTSRFFYVRFREDGRVVTVNTDHATAITGEDARAFADEVIKTGERKGYLRGTYKYIVDESEYNGKTVYFMDVSESLVSMFIMVTSSVSIGFIGWVLLLVAVIPASKRAVRPIVENTVRQKQFITDAGHELKTPLAIISANTEVLEMMYGENEWFTSIRNQTNRLSDLIKNLLVLSKAEEKSQKDSFSEVAVSDIVSATVASFSAVAQRSNKRLYAEVQPTLSIWGNEKSIAELANILLDNAVKYAPDGSKVELNLYKKGRQVVLETSNVLAEGVEVDTDRVFDRFYRSEKSRSRQTGGYGIGLSIAGAIVKAHKANISVESEDNKIKFTVLFKLLEN